MWLMVGLRVGCLNRDLWDLGIYGILSTSCHPYQESGHPQGVSLQSTYFRILLQKPIFFRFFFYNYDNYARIPPKKMVFNAQLGDCARL